MNIIERRITMQALERRHNDISATYLRSPEMNQEGVRPVGEFHCLGSVLSASVGASIVLTVG